MNSQKVKVQLCFVGSQLYLNFAGSESWRRRIRRSMLLGAAVLLLCSAVSPVFSQSCPTIPFDGGSTIWGQLKDNATGAIVSNGARLPRYTQLRLDSIATVAGYCLTCTQYDRTVNHIDIWMEDSTTGWNGSYQVGYVVGKNPDGTTAFYNVLDTQASNSTGPAYQYLMFPGTYHFKFQGVLNYGTCFDLPRVTDIQTITVYVGDADEDPENSQEA